MRSGVSGGAFVLLQTVRVAARPCKATCLPSSGAHACTLALYEACLSGDVWCARVRVHTCRSSGAAPRFRGLLFDVMVCRHAAVQRD